jgi:FtsP/CotA-like multicopper oxidase with cupredoxin domain
MSKRFTSRSLSRRTFLKLGGGGALASMLGGVLPASAAAPISPARASGGWVVNIGGTLAQPLSKLRLPPRQAGATQVRLVATDGWINLPGRADPMFVFSFREAGYNAPVTEITDDLKGGVQIPAPILDFTQNTDVYIRMTNIGLVQRPDLDDSHTVHWHGFPNAISFFDGEPNASVAVPVARNFDYFYRPRDPGTYMYHCHFEDVEHIQMGMTGVIFVRPSLGPNYAYNDPGTQFDRQFVMLVTEIDANVHDGLAAVQEFDWTEYKPEYFFLNGRAYPHTLLPNNDPSLPNQPYSSLITANAGDRVLLRFVNLGFYQHAVQTPGIPLRVIGADARLLRGRGGEDLSYRTHTVYIGPGESRDVLFTAPAVSSPTTYALHDRNYHYLTNNGGAAAGGVMTEIRVYPAGTLGPQAGPNQ